MKCAGCEGKITVCKSRGRLAKRIMRQRGEAEMPTSNQSPCVDQGRRLLRPAALHTCPLASLLSQVRAHLGPGGYRQRSGNGGPQTCLPAARGVAPLTAQYGPSTSTQAQYPCEGPSLAGRMTQGFLRGASPGRLTRSGDSKAGQTSRGSHDVSHDERHQAGARRAPVRAASLFPLWC